MSYNLKDIQEDLLSFIPKLETEINNDQLIIQNFGLNDLKVVIDNRVVFYLSKVKELDPDDLSLFLELKLPVNDISKKYINGDSMYLYPSTSFNSDKIGSWKKKMWIIRLIRSAYSSIDSLRNDLDLKPLI